MTLVEMLVSIAIIGLLIAVILPAVQSSRAAAAKIDCQSRLKQIILAAHEYEESFHMLPGTRGGNSWPRRLMPYLEENELSETHRALACPADPLAEGRLYRSMHSFHINNGFGDNEGYLHSRSDLKVSAISDGLSQTAAFAERLAVPDPERYPFYPMLDPQLWIRTIRETAVYNADLREYAEECGERALSPHNATFGFRGYTHILTPNRNSCFNGPVRIDPEYFRAAITPTSLHSGGIHLALADGSVRFISNSVDRDVWWALGTRAGNELEAASGN